jgi:hypothetical protein
MTNIRDQIRLLLKQHPHYSFTRKYDVGGAYLASLEQAWAFLDERLSERSPLITPSVYDTLAKQDEKLLKIYIREIYKKDDLSKLLQTTINEVVGAGPVKWMFITIGFNDEVVSPFHMKRVQAQMERFNGFSDIKYVHEKFRLSGIHHHTHYLVKTDLAKSTVLQKIWQFARIKEVVVGKQFIDIKTHKDGSNYENYLKYISGEKKPDKLPLVEQDKKWRQENNL